MTRYIAILTVLLAFMPTLANAEQTVRQLPNSGYTPSYTLEQSYIAENYPQGFDQEYRLPNNYGNKYYNQETEKAVGQYGQKRSAQVEGTTYMQQYYYY